MKNKKIHVALVAVLSVLLAASVAATLVTAVRYGKPAEPEPIVPGEVIPGTPGGTIELTDGQKGQALPIVAENFLPGDRAEKTYTVKVTDGGAKAITFSSVLTEGTLPGDKLTITVTAGDAELYGGSLAANPVIEYPIDGQCEENFTISIALDPTAGSEYADLSVEADFVWSYHADGTGWGVITYTDGASGEAFADVTFERSVGDPTPAYPGTPERQGYEFLGWDPAVSETVQGSMTYTALWKGENTAEPYDMVYVFIGADVFLYAVLSFVVFSKKH